MMNKISKNHIGVSKQTYDTVIKRDKNKCVLCGRDGNYYALQLHHIMNRQFKKLIDDPNNCVMLCCKCHQMVHQHQNIYREGLKEYVEQNIAR